MTAAAEDIDDMGEGDRMVPQNPMTPETPDPDAEPTPATEPDPAAEPTPAAIAKSEAAAKSEADSGQTDAPARAHGGKSGKSASSSPDLGQGSVPRLLFKLAVPSVIAQLVNLLYNIVDRIFIGHIAEVGATALTGVGLFAPILIFITSFAMLFGSGGAPRAAIFMGKRDNATAEHILGNCFSLMMVTAVVLTVVLYVFAPELLVWFGASSATLPYALPYSRIYVLGSIFVMIVMGMNPFINTQGFAKFSMVTTLLGAGLNLVLDPILIFGLGLGVRGAALASVISQAVSAAWVMRFLTGNRTKLKLRASNFRPIARIIGPCLALGVSTFVMNFTESLLSICYNSSLSRYGGDLAVGTMTILLSCMLLIQMPIQGVCQGAQPIMGYNFGAGNSERVKSAFRCLYIVGVSYSTVFWAVIMLNPQMFAAIFTNDAELIAYAATYIPVFSAGVFAMGSQSCCQMSFVSLGQAKVSLVMALLRKVILLIPLILILPLLMPGRAVFAVFLAEPISDILAATVTTTLFFTRFNKTLAKGPQA